MAKIIFVLIAVLIPAISFGQTVNNQSTYAVPPGSTNVLILDLTLPEVPSSITVFNDGTAQQTDIIKISVFEDGASAGWDNDEKNVAAKVYSPFFGAKISGDFSQKRIFVTVSIASNAGSGRTIKPKIKTDISDEEILGLERKILAGASALQIPIAPSAQNGEAISSSAIRWYFSDLSNNEFGFRILDNQLKRMAVRETADLSYLDETGLEPETCYSGRRVAAYNDRGESDYSVNFSEICTLAAPVVEVQPLEEIEPQATPVEEVKPETVEEDQGVVIRQKIIDILNQIIQLLQEKIVILQAGIFQILRFFLKF